MRLDKIASGLDFSQRLWIQTKCFQAMNTRCSGDPYLIPWQLEDKEWNVILSA